MTESLQIVRYLKCGEELEPRVTPSTRVHESSYFHSPIDYIGSAVFARPVGCPRKAGHHTCCTQGRTAHWQRPITATQRSSQFRREKYLIYRNHSPPYVWLNWWYAFQSNRTAPRKIERKACSQTDGEACLASVWRHAPYPRDLDEDANWLEA